MLISAKVKSQRAFFIALILPIFGVGPNNSQTFEHIPLKFSRYYVRYFYPVCTNLYVHICNSKITSGGINDEYINILYVNFHADICNNSRGGSGFLSLIHYEQAKCGFINEC